MKVEVAYAGPEGLAVVPVEIADGANVADAVSASAIVERFGLLQAALSYAIHGQRAQAATPVRAGDRIELLRPLIADAKQARRTRAIANPLPRSRPRSKRRTTPS